MQLGKRPLDPTGLLSGDGLYQPEPGGDRAGRLTALPLERIGADSARVRSFVIRDGRLHLKLVIYAGDYVRDSLTERRQMRKLQQFASLAPLSLTLAATGACSTESQASGTRVFRYEGGGDLRVTFGLGRAIVRT